MPKNDLKNFKSSYNKNLKYREMSKHLPIKIAKGNAIDVIRVNLGEIKYNEMQQPTICVADFRP